MQRRIENKELVSTSSAKKKARTCQQPESTSRTYPGVPSSDRAMTHEFCDSSCQTLHTIHSKDESNLDSPSSQSEFVASECRAEVADRILERTPCTIMTTEMPIKPPT